MRSFLSFLLSLFIAYQPVYAAAPVIWGPDGAAKMLNSGSLVTKSGRSVDATGPVNFAGNTDAATDLTGIVASGTGITATRTTTAAEVPLSPYRTTGIKLANGGSGTGGTSIACFQVPTPYKSTMLALNWQHILGAGYVAGDYKVAVYSETNATCTGTETALTLSTDSGGNSLINGGPGYRTTFSTTSADYYEVKILRVAGSSGATSWLALGNLYVGPGLTVQGAVVSAPSSYAFTVSGFGTSPASAFIGTRVGSSLQVQGAIKVTNATGASTFQITLPTGLTADFSAIASTVSGTISGANSNGVVGKASWTNNATGAMYVGSLYFLTNTSLNIYGDSGATAWNATVPAAILTTTSVEVELSIPIAEWAGSGTVNLAQNDVEYVCSTSGTWDAAASSGQTLYGPAGCPISGSLTANRIKVVQWQTPLQPGQSPWLEYRLAGTNSWVKQENSVYALVIVNAVTFGTYNSATTSTTGSYTFSQFAQPGSSYNTTTAAGVWSAGTYDAWRVVKANPGQTTGFSEVVPGRSAGLVPSYGLPGRTNGATVPAGSIGEQIVSVATANIGTSNANITSITLTPGVWIMTGLCFYNGASGNVFMRCGISPTSASLTGTTNGYDVSVGAGVSANGVGSVSVPGKYVNITASTTYYLISAVSTTAANIDGSIQGVRIAP